MARTILNVIATLIAIVAIISGDAPAQQLPTSSQQPAPEERAPARAAKDTTTTMTGCVRAAASPGGFILANTDPVSEPRGTAPAVAGQSADISGQTYTLIAATGEDLTRHLNHKVEVSGILGPPTPPSADSGTVKLVVEPVGTITVQSLKMISTSCP